MNSKIWEHLIFQQCMKFASFDVWVRYFAWNFKGILWNSTQNISPIYWKMCTLLSSGTLIAPRFMSTLSFLNTPLMWLPQRVTGYMNFYAAGSSQGYTCGQGIEKVFLKKKYTLTFTKCLPYYCHKSESCFNIITDNGLTHVLHPQHHRVPIHLPPVQMYTH